MELDRILQSLEDYLKPLAAPMGGSVQVSLDPWDTVEMLRTGPAKFRIILAPEDESPVEDNGAGGWVLGNLTAYVQVHQGLVLPRGKSLHRATTSQPVSCLALAAAVRGMLRGVGFDSPDINSCQGLMFRGSEWFVDADDEKSQWKIRALRFALYYRLDSSTNGVDVPEVVGQYLRIPTPSGPVQARMVWVNATTSPTIRLAVEGAYLYVTHPGGTHRLRLLALP
jgi:hypothetical protein